MRTTHSTGRGMVCEEVRLWFCGALDVAKMVMCVSLQKSRSRQGLVSFSSPFLDFSSP